MNDHSDCWFGHPCQIGRAGSCPPNIAEGLRDKGKPWSELIVKREPGGLRHYLNGKPIHCGYTLELQRVTTKSDDYGEYTSALQDGVVVRYEASQDGREISATLYGDIAGYDAVIRLEPYMRFRWPGGRS